PVFMQSIVLKILLVIVATILLVWLLVARPDRAAELARLKQQLAAEADLRSQALEFAMAKYRQAAVLLARTDIIHSIADGDTGQNNLDRLFYLQALSGITSAHLLTDQNASAIPETQMPLTAVESNRWRRGTAMAFQGSLGRSFYRDAQQRPVYVFFTPVLDDTAEVKAILIAKIDLGLIRDSWQVSGNHIALHDASTGALWFDNEIPAPRSAVTIERPRTPMGAVLRISTSPPAVLGAWVLRSLILALLFLLAAVLTISLMARRRFLAALAAQREGEALRLEQEVNARTAELEKIQKQLILTEKLALLGQMSASISHEVNQPLAAIKNYATSARRQLEKHQTDRLPVNLEKIEKLCDRVARIILNLRSFATNDQSPVGPLELTSVLSEAISEFHNRFPNAHAATTLQVTQSPTTVVGGRVRLLQVLGNLLTNAWYACRDQQSPAITISVNYIDNHRVEIRLTDNGPGIDAGISSQVFDAFVTRRNEKTGLGLGLSISRSFIESMDGELSVEKSGAAGTTFLITLNAAK
ncbi:MAG: ATP-binding protein, partial [Pseudomonadota bacterium]